MKSHEKKFLDFIEDSGGKIGLMLMATGIEDADDFCTHLSIIYIGLKKIFTKDKKGKVVYYGDLEDLCNLLNAAYDYSIINFKSMMDILETVLENNYDVASKTNATTYLSMEVIDQCRKYYHDRVPVLEILDRVNNLDLLEDGEEKENLKRIYDTSKKCMENDSTRFHRIKNNSLKILNYIHDARIDIKELNRSFEELNLTDFMINKIHEYRTYLESKIIKDYGIYDVTDLFSVSYKKSELSKKDIKLYESYIDAYYDIDTKNFKQRMSYNKVYEIAEYIYKVYGEDATREYFKTLEYKKDITDNECRFYLLSDRIMHYNTIFNTEEIEDLKNYLEFIKEFGFGECAIEATQFIRKMEKYLPNSIEFEVELVKSKVNKL